MTSLPGVRAHSREGFEILPYPETEDGGSLASAVEEPDSAQHADGDDQELPPADAHMNSVQGLLSRLAGAAAITLVGTSF